MFPTLALDFLNGLKLAFRNSGLGDFVPNFIIESVGNATGDPLLRTAEKMILQEDVDLTISFCSIFKLKELIGIFNAYKKPLIHVDLGGNVLKEEHISPHVIHHTLNLWQSAYFSGVYAANTFGKYAAVAASFYDGGYHLTESFVRGFTDNGGTIVYSYVSPMDYKSESFKTMIEGLQNADPDVIYTLFSYKEGDKIFDVFSQSQLNGKIPLLAGPLMTEEINFKSNYNIENIFSVASWSFNDETSQMSNFLMNYSNSYNVIPNIISLIGYEVGLTISSFIKENGDIPAKIGDFINSFIIDSPRGKLTFSKFNETQVALHKIRQFLFNDNHYNNTVVNTFNASNQEGLYEKFKDVPDSGWQNPYIIT